MATSNRHDNLDNNDSYISNRAEEHVSVPKIVGLASPFATQNCFGCYSKLNLGSKFHANFSVCFGETDRAQVD